MPAGRFILPGAALADGAEVALPDDVGHQARDVLRLAPGATLALLDGRGGEWTATLVAVGRAAVRVRLGARTEAAGEPCARVVLYQGLLKAAKFEWVLQKGTELGVAAFVPLRTERAVTGAEDVGANKRARWQRILTEATEQCGRVRVPELADLMPLAEAARALPPGALALIPWERERASSLRAALAEKSEMGVAPAIHLFIGPEGGFAESEVALAREHGARAVSLGPRILRAETAAIAAVTLALAACGDLD
jgi:16S rRNA (uracil1498-N3)-methyltransferase